MSTYVFGHQSPDADSICSAIAYANLKQKLGDTDVIPARLGKINKEVEFALETFGVEFPIEVTDVTGEQIILVDHNEHSQSANGINKADVLEIIDHHKVAIPDTGKPILVRIEPVGCTSTIVAKMYKENDLTPSKSMAGLMLSAILSDTLIFKSPTCTPQDEKVARELATIAEVDLETYGKDLLAAGTSLEGMTAKDLLDVDRKAFKMGKYNVAVAQINTSDAERLETMKPEIREEINNIIDKDGLSLVILMMTDLVKGGSEILAIGQDKHLADQTFGIEANKESVFLEDVYSRKKQIIPQLTATAQNS
ncbi:MAG: manganese-dependent inorganic pyrophosphatase [Epulopiscium sp. Nele67-Bin005]|nr:MAG: manganese-dependent inorganic pyrophosphatase [Epulopiscium sp. Nele67-Bin005]